MFTYSKEVTDYFMKYLHSDIQIDEFREWIYANNIGDIIGEHFYNELFYFDYYSIFSEDDLYKLIVKTYKNESKDFGKELVLWIIDGIANRTYDIVLGCNQLAKMRSFEKGFEFIPIQFVGYASEIEDIDDRYKYGSKEDSLEKDRIIGLYKQDIVNLSRKFLNEIKEN